MISAPFIRIDTENQAADAQTRAVQLAQALQAAAFLEDCACRSATGRQRWSDLDSLCRGIYDELRQQAPAAPDAPVSLLIARQVNRALGLAAQLLRGDPYFGYFVRSFPAKDGLPPYRDVMCVLRQLLESLNRFDRQLTERQELIAERLREARTISAALVIAGETAAGYVLRRDVERRGVDPHPAWFVDFKRSLSCFNFKKLNETLLESYFRAGL